MGQLGQDFQDTSMILYRYSGLGLKGVDEFASLTLLLAHQRCIVFLVILSSLVQQLVYPALLQCPLKVMLISSGTHTRQARLVLR
jgi:hypothetical protein